MYTDIPNRILEKYDRMTKAEKKIASFMLEQKDDLQLTTITELAEYCGVADSTVFRFCKLLGYGGYNEFKLALAQEQGLARGQSGEPQNAKDETAGTVTTEDDVVTTGIKLKNLYFAAIAQTLQLLDPESVKTAARLLYDSQRVYCFGSGGSMIMAMEAWGRFAMVAGQFATVPDTHLQLMSAAHLTERDAVWFFSYSGSTRDMVDILSVVKENGARVVAVTRFKNSPIAQYADVILVCGSNENPRQPGSIVAKIAQLTVIDMVYEEYMRDRKSVV